MIIKISPEIISLDKKFQGICKKSYYGHSKGCPNYGKKDGCPPGLPLLDEIFDFKKDIYLIHTTFSIGKFAEKMKNAYPEWSKHPRQWYNPRRWQGTAKKEHKQELEKFVLENPEKEFNKFPEAHGVNVTNLMKNVGIGLNWQWPPEHNLENISYLVSIGGIRK
jgi:predicted metal-binding protein